MKDAAWIVLPCDVWSPPGTAYFVEAPAFFSRYPCHKAKLALMRAAMKAAAAACKGDAHYVDHDRYAAFLKRVSPGERLACRRPCDVPLEEELARALPGLTFVPCERFLLDDAHLEAFHREHGAKSRILFGTFFKAAKARLGVLERVPSTDALNRRGPDRDAIEPGVPAYRDAAKHREEAREYVLARFGDFASRRINACQGDLPRQLRMAAMRLSGLVPEFSASCYTGYRSTPQSRR